LGDLVWLADGRIVYSLSESWLNYSDTNLGQVAVDPKTGTVSSTDYVPTSRRNRLQGQGKGPNDTRPIIDDLLVTGLPQIERGLKEER